VKNDSCCLKCESAIVITAKTGEEPATVIPGRGEDANPESRDSQMCNRTSEV
jgi:hypothetical protein